MIDKRQLLWALAALLLVVVVAFGLSLTAGNEAEETATAVQEREEAIQDACASSETFRGLKQLVFQQASSGRAADPVNYDILAASAVVRMENPVVTSRDPELNQTSCSGRFILELPPGAENAFNGERRLTAEVDYEVQEAADGSGPVYRMRGAEDVVSRLAAFNLQGQRLRMPATPLPADPFGNMFEPAPAELVTIPDAPPAPPPQVRSDPSFDCDDARTRGELMVCGSHNLAAKDRSMAAMYEAAEDEGNRRTRRALRRTRDNFLAYRDRCTTEACVSQAYDGRMREIRDIVAAED